MTPSYFSSIEELKNTIINFQDRYEKIGKPFEWKNTKNDLSEYMRKFDRFAVPLAISA